MLDKENFKKSQAYKNKSHSLIPGGAHTYSKGDDQFPEIAPAAITHGSGAWVWDLDGNKFLDCSMGLFSVCLGHAYEPVLERVRAELLKGVNFQRPSSIEIEIAEKFLANVPFHQMIKFAKNGSTVTTAAVKLARAFTRRSMIAFPGNHPFYSYDDWFIGRTQSNRGVPGETTELSVTFEADNLDSLRQVFEKYPGQIACVISEPEKWTPLPEGYLQKAIDLAHKHGALYIFDEMITGYKSGFPGASTKYGVEPDMCTWGKGIANGFSFCCLTGKREVMEIGGINRPGQEKVFLISTTHGGETHAIGAAIATLEEFKNKNVLAHNQAMGQQVLENTIEIVKAEGLENYIEVMGKNWMPAYNFNNGGQQPSMGFRTLFMQEMIRMGVLFQGVFTPCYSHNENEVQFFLEAFQHACRVYKTALEYGYEKYLVGEPMKPVFRKII